MTFFLNDLKKFFEIIFIYPARHIILILCLLRLFKIMDSKNLNFVLTIMHGIECFYAKLTPLALGLFETTNLIEIGKL